MHNKYLFNFLLLIVLFLSCNESEKSNYPNPSQVVTINKNPIVTDLSLLHDSIQPKITVVNEEVTPFVKMTTSPKKFDLPYSINLLDSSISIHPESQGEGLFTTFTSDDGLALDAISRGQRSMFCDSKGNLWFGTYGGGVSKYNGKSFENFSTDQGLVKNIISSVMEDSKGNIWLGAHEGISKYDGKIFTNFTKENGLLTSSIRGMEEDKDGNIWFATSNGVSKYNGESFTTYTTDDGLVDDYVNCVIEDVEGNLWFGTNKGLTKYDGVNFTNFTIKEGLANSAVMSLLEGSTGDLFIGTYNGLSVFDGLTFTNYTEDQGLVNNLIRGIIEDRNGDFWIGTFGGVSRFDGESFTSFTSENGLVSNSISNLVEDKMGNIWFGGYGLSIYRGKSFVSYNTKQNLAHNYVRSILSDKNNNIWFGTARNGICNYNGKTFTTYPVGKGLLSDATFSLLEDKNGYIWVGNEGTGVSLIKGDSLKIYTSKNGLANNYVRSVYEDREGNIWFGTSKGASKFNGKTFINYSKKQGLSSDFILCIMEDSYGNIWFGTSAGVSKLNGNTITNYSTEQGLSNELVNSIIEDETGNLWFATYGGGIDVLQIEKNREELKNNDKVEFLTLNNYNGLPDNGVSAIRQDKKGRIIIGTNFGILVLSPSEVEQVVKTSGSTFNGKIGVVYNQFTGYPIKDVNAGQNNGSMCIDNNEVLWVACGEQGITRIDLDEVITNENPLDVYLTEVGINGEKVCYYSLSNDGKKVDSTTLVQQEIFTYGKQLSSIERDSLILDYEGITFDSIKEWYAIPKGLVLPYNKNALTFEFNALETGRNYLVNYQFTLRKNKNVNEAWSQPSAKTTATYNHLSEGEYTFLVKAQNPEGIWSEPISYSFTVLPPWYRTWWAFLLYFIIGGFVLWFYIRMRTKKLKKRQIILEKKVKNATYEIRNQKDEIEFQKGVVEKAHDNIKASINYAKRIQDGILPSINEVKDTVPDSFIYFNPKDVVAGDFYWLEKHDSLSLIAVADCTGHGVPGAMMSLICYNALNRSVREFGLSDPGKILDKTRNLILEEDMGADMGDGMDIALCNIEYFDDADKGYCNIKYAGAYNPFWIIRKDENGDAKIIEIKADNQPVSKFFKYKPFTTHQIEMKKDDIFYIFSDGYMDQFGGEDGLKFGLENFKNLLLSIHNKPMTEQLNILESSFAKWKGFDGIKQLDDVCVMGVRL